MLGISQPVAGSCWGTKLGFPRSPLSHKYHYDQSWGVKFVLAEECCVIWFIFPWLQLGWPSQGALLPPGTAQWQELHSSLTPGNAFPLGLSFNSKVLHKILHFQVAILISQPNFWGCFPSLSSTLPGEISAGETHRPHP